MIRHKKRFKILFTNRGFVVCDSYDQRESGIYWINGSIQGYSRNQMIKSVEELI